jgi:hypothetical protein
MSAVKEAALGYAAKGIAVLPTDGKRAHLTGHGYLDATTDVDVIEAWWNKYPAANVAVYPGSADLLVVDIDVKGEVDGHDTLNILEAEHGKLPDTRTAVTPSGGVHYYFRVPGDETFGNRQIKPGGIDIRCSAGYVVAAPSSICGKSYRWTNDLKSVPLPDAWVEFLRDKPYVPPSSGERFDAPSCGSVPSERDTRTRYLSAAYDDELDKLLRAPDGDGNNQVCRYGFSLGQLIPFGMREDNIRAGAEWVFSQWKWRKPSDLAAARRTLEAGIRAGQATPRKGAA